MWSCIIGAIGDPVQDVHSGMGVGLWGMCCAWCDHTATKCPAACAGVALPVVVPPIRESLSKPTPVQPPDVKKVGRWVLHTAGLPPHSAPC